MRWKHPEQPRPFKTPLGAASCRSMGMLVNFALMYSLGCGNWLRLFVWFALGQAIYFARKRKRAQAGA